MPYQLSLRQRQQLSVSLVKQTSRLLTVLTVYNDREARRRADRKNAIYTWTYSYVHAFIGLGQCGTVGIATLDYIAMNKHKSIEYSFSLI